MKNDGTGRFSPHKAKSPPRSGDRESPEERDREEGRADDLGGMVKRLGRRAIALQIHVLHRLREEHERTVERTLRRTLGEEEYARVDARLRGSKAKAAEHARKAAAEGIDYVTGLLDVVWGRVDEEIERGAGLMEAQQALARFAARLGAMSDERLETSVARAAVLKTYIEELLRTDRDLFSRMDVKDRKEIIEFALGQRPEPPSVLAELLKVQEERDRPIAPIQSRQRLQYDIAAGHSNEVELTLENLDDRAHERVRFHVGLTPYPSAEDARRHLDIDLSFSPSLVDLPAGGTRTVKVRVESVPDDCPRDELLHVPVSVPKLGIIHHLLPVCVHRGTESPDPCEPKTKSGPEEGEAKG